MILQRPPIEINSDGRMTRCDLWPQEVALVNYMRRLEDGSLIIFVSAGLPVEIKESMKRVKLAGKGEDG